MLDLWEILTHGLIIECGKDWIGFFYPLLGVIRTLVKVEHLSRALSDHCPLLLTFPAFVVQKSSFRFQKMWIRHADFILIVRLNWMLPCSSSGMQKLQLKLKRLKNHLKWWNAEVFGNIHDKVRVAESDFAAAGKNFDVNPTTENKIHMAKAQALLQKTLYMEEDFWKQKAAVRWMGEGDRNTKFFHHLAQKKKLAGRIFRIWEDGVCIEKPELIQASGASFFENLLSGENEELNTTSMENIPSLINAEENLALLAIPSIEEVKQVIGDMCEDSAAGPDGFSVAFYVACWEIIKLDVYEAVLDFFQGGFFPRGMAATTIVLIPKMDNAQRWQDFRPISLCNVSNKIISKLMVNRLGKVLDKIISPMQSGFVAGRLISDNILLAQELYHKLNYHVRGGNLILKLDMAKAYDRIQWEFLFQIMKAFGFTEPVIDLSHLAYADDVMIFMNGSINNVKRLMISTETGFNEGSGPILYLGVPLFSGNRKAVYFQPLIEKVLMPPKSVLKQLEMICANFFWGFSASKKKAHWISWANICTPKLEGGLGVRRLLEVSKGVSLKLWFRFRMQNSLWARYLSKQYCGAVSPVVVPLKGNASPAWKRMVQIRALAENHIGWTVGSGRLSFWHDGWLDRGPIFHFCEVVGNQEALVLDFREEEGWNWDRLRAILPTDVAEEVADCAVQNGADPTMIWKPSPKGVFSMKSAWNCIRDRRQALDMGNAIWNSVLQIRGVSLASKCKFCEEVESWGHLFFHCQVAREVWAYFAHWFRVADYKNIVNWRVGDKWMKQGHMREACPFIILWFLWVARNDAKHRDIIWSAWQIIGKVIQYVVTGMSAGLIKGWHWKGFSTVAVNFGLKIQLQTVTNISVIRWQKPMMGTFKLNSDGCSRGNPGLSSYGCIIRDHAGQVIKAMHGVIGVGSNVRAELFAIWKGLELCVASNFLPLWLESDSLAALNIIEASSCSWEFRNLVLKIQEVVRKFRIRCSHTYREANMAADYLANKAFEWDGIRLMDGDSIERDLFGIYFGTPLWFPAVLIFYFSAGYVSVILIFWHVTGLGEEERGDGSSGRWYVLVHLCLLVACTAIASLVPGPVEWKVDGEPVKRGVRWKGDWSLFKWWNADLWWVVDVMLLNGYFLVVEMLICVGDSFEADSEIYVGKDLGDVSVYAFGFSATWCYGVFHLSLLFRYGFKWIGHLNIGGLSWMLSQSFEVDEGWKLPLIFGMAHLLGGALKNYVVDGYNMDRLLFQLKGFWIMEGIYCLVVKGQRRCLEVAEQGLRGMIVGISHELAAVHLKCFSIIEGFCCFGSGWSMKVT
ncbi:LOW QUALITY PROTEIN: uncharacterized protein LOC141829202 [Curcuma longa]|uniref:LOW QUALITY PROTEIN: uncharacterized protein LOC141829202 n=1 Tax=Curcuma longa TaxID=136217 RepID=UPI003D9F481C